MEKTFNKIVLSKTEPNVEDLWMRINIERLPEGSKYGKKFKHGHSLWWFSPFGWKKLFDFDTRYNVSTDYMYNGTPELPLQTETDYNPEIGIVKVVNTYYVYDGATRDLKNTRNLVNETGLKKHVDDLQSQIDALKRRIEQAEERISTLEKGLNNEITNRASDFSNLSSKLGSLESRISSLESAI